MPPRPFLYLPDALSLTLLIVALTVLRRAAIVHLRQELLRLRKEMILYWSGNELPFDQAAYQQLCALLAEMAELAPRLSPARLFFVHRLASKSGRGELWSSPKAERPVAQSGSAGDHQVKLKLQRLHLEMNLAVGTFFLLGSISGWMLLCYVLLRLAVRRIKGRSASRVGFFDLSEKLISRIGFDAVKLGTVANVPHPAFS
jgi:hypothetical protein